MKSIAVFERNEDVADLIEFILTEAGHTVTICRDPEALCAALPTAELAIIETFYLSPHAIEYLHSLCEAGMGPQMICATGVPASASCLLRNERTRMLMKPFAADELLGLVEQCETVESC
jgi:DNA-binding NtrC family response regulator